MALRISHKELEKLINEGKQLMSNFTRFNHKSLINPAYQDSEQYIPLKDIPFKKSADLFAINPEMVFSIRAMYRSSGDYGEQIVAIVNAESDPDSVFRMALPVSILRSLILMMPALLPIVIRDSPVSALHSTTQRDLTRNLTTSSSFSQICLF